MSLSAIVANFGRSVRGSSRSPLASRLFVDRALGRHINGPHSASCLSTAAGEKKIALVLGSSGALGSTVSRYLSRERGMVVLGADVVELAKEFDESDWDLDGFISVPHIAQNPSIEEVTTQLATGVNRILGDSETIDTIVCASGGWQGDPQPRSGNLPTAIDIEQNAKEYSETMDRMIHMNLFPVIAAGCAAQQFMGPGGLFVVIGATAALSPTPGMMAYGIAKGGAHHLVQTMGASTGKSLETQAKRHAGRRVRQFAENMDTMSCIGVLPTTIDTFANRQAMPDGDFDKWIKPRDIAVQIGKWVDVPQLRPHSGCLVKASSSEDGTVFEIAR